jgi:hypothetical protein
MKNTRMDGVGVKGYGSKAASFVWSEGTEITIKHNFDSSKSVEERIQLSLDAIYENMKPTLLKKLNKQMNTQTNETEQIIVPSNKDMVIFNKILRDLKKKTKQSNNSKFVNKKCNINNLQSDFIDFTKEEFVDDQYYV